MDSKKVLVKLLNENEDAREKFKKLGDVPKEDADKELKKFQEEFGIELRQEDFADEELDDEQLEGVAGGAGGAGGVGAADIISIGLSIYQILDRPDCTRRGTKGGTKRYNS